MCFVLIIVCSTLTDPVTFEKCLTAIKDNAFVISDYPVCVTLEDHLTQELQAKAAEVSDFSNLCFSFFFTSPLRQVPAFVVLNW